MDDFQLEAEGAPAAVVAEPVAQGSLDLRHLTACDIDRDYFAAASERIKRETAQQTLFAA